MLGEELGLGIHKLGEMGFEYLRDPPVQLPPGAAQQAAVRHVLYQRVLEGIHRVGWRAALEDQLRSDEAFEGGLQVILGKTRNGAQQAIGKLTADGGANLRDQPHFAQAVEPRH